ncbi:MAG: iron-sulfur cluster assembly scaffold protein [Candidatus Woesearchaeota archaeon]|nr:MAG: iron-sulfur cluster assembly scaffold protein [Candidatus Woesearchaeota archaeon]GIU70508.1 MAG: iron-sulfur cluster assembly scaffold protein [Candidatus Woesearchaeota archaeon]GIX42284.1 MAG: iron-sulfur cluster assembly scaffold protein [Leptospiraceae bacterium]
MSLSEDLYKEIIIEYSQNPKHYGELPEANIHEEGVNRSCGDEVYLHLYIDGDEIKKATFTGQGCSICTASTEMMTTYIENHKLEEVKKLIELFKNMIMSKEDISLPENYEDLEALKGVKKFPIRVKCATLSWNTLEQAIREYEKQNN